MDGPRDWKTEAEELRRVVENLRSRLLALGRVLPAEYVSFLEQEPGDMEAGASGWDLYEGWRDTIDVVNSDVATELELLWERLDPRRRS